MRKQLCRELVVRLRQDRRKMLINYDGGSLAERQRAQHDAEQPSSILQDIVASTTSTAAPAPAPSDDVDSFHQRAINYLRTHPIPSALDTSDEDVVNADYMINIDEDDYDDPESGCQGLIKVLRAQKIGKENKEKSQDLSAKIELARKQKMAKTASGSGKEKAVTDEDGGGDGQEVEVVEVDGDVSGPAEFEQDEEAPDSSIDVGQVRLAFMRRVLAPIMEEREMKKWFEVSYCLAPLPQFLTLSSRITKAGFAANANAVTTIIIARTTSLPQSPTCSDTCAYAPFRKMSSPSLLRQGRHTLALVRSRRTDVDS